MMEIIVSVKQVPDVAELRIDPVTHNLVREGAPSILNPLDRLATEEALRIRELLGGKVTIISMGPPQARAAVEECLAMGADEGMLLSDIGFAAADTLATAMALADAIRKYLRYDLILMGQKAIDAETGQVGPQVAELLGIPHVAYVNHVEVHNDELTARRLRTEGIETVECSLPALVTVTKEINEPRLASLRSTIAAKRKPIRIVTVKDLEKNPERYGLKGSPTIVSRVFTPPPRGACRILEGSTSDVVNQLVAILAEKAFLSRAP
jgi:electron transfer flavoprotein beta subunit